MKKKIHKIAVRLGVSGFFGLWVILCYGIYTMWTRDNTNMTRTELNAVITYLSVWVTIGVIAVFTDDF